MEATNKYVENVMVQVIGIKKIVVPLPAILQSPREAGTYLNNYKKCAFELLLEMAKDISTVYPENSEQRIIVDKVLAEMALKESKFFQSLDKQGLIPKTSRPDTPNIHLQIGPDKIIHRSVFSMDAWEGELYKMMKTGIREAIKYGKNAYKTEQDPALQAKLLETLGKLEVYSNYMELLKFQSQSVIAEEAALYFIEELCEKLDNLPGGAQFKADIDLVQFLIKTYSLDTLKSSRPAFLSTEFTNEEAILLREKADKAFDRLKNKIVRERTFSELEKKQLVDDLEKAKGLFHAKNDIIYAHPMKSTPTSSVRKTATVALSLASTGLGVVSALSLGTAAILPVTAPVALPLGVTVGGVAGATGLASTALITSNVVHNIVHGALPTVGEVTSMLLGGVAAAGSGLSVATSLVHATQGIGAVQSIGYVQTAIEHGQNIINASSPLMDTVKTTTETLKLSKGSLELIKDTKELKEELQAKPDDFESLGS